LVRCASRRYVQVLASGMTRLRPSPSPSPELWCSCLLPLDPTTFVFVQSARLHCLYGARKDVRSTGLRTTCFALLISQAAGVSNRQKHLCRPKTWAWLAQSVRKSCAKACRLRLGSPWLQGAAELKNGEARESYRKGTKIREMGFCYCPGFLEDCRLLRSEFGWTGNRLA
jgi:hypothetical protein